MSQGMSQGNGFYIWRDAEGAIKVTYLGRELATVQNVHELVQISLDLAAEVVDFVGEEFK